MTKQDWIYVIAAAAGAASVVLWVALILVPAVGSYKRAVDRIAATVLSLYVLGAMVLAGSLVGAAFLYYFDEL